MLDRLKLWTGVTGQDYPKPWVAISNIGPVNYLKFLYRQWTDPSRGAPRSLRVKGVSHPVLYRPGSTDIKVFSQIFLFREYALLDAIRAPGLIVDCGANVGYSSAYFLNRFPQARLIAVEPDSTNYAILERNLAPYGDRVETLQTAIWSHPARLIVESSSYRDGGEWSRQVRECLPADAEGFVATDIGAILRHSGLPRIGLLKIDVEGAEGVLFAGSQLAWIDQVDCIVIELHNDTQFGDNRTLVVNALENAGFQVRHSGELSIATRTGRAKSELRSSR